MIQKGEITAAVSFVAILGFFLFLASVLSGCGGDQCNGFGSCVPIGDVPEDAALECRTISVDQCFAVQCGYGLLPHLQRDGEILANELFCPEDYFDCSDEYERGYNDALGMCPDVIVIETDEETCDLSVPVGHRPIECRGKR